MQSLSKIAFTNFLGATPIRRDVEFFLQKYRLEAAGTASTFESVSIGNAPPAIDTAAELTPSQVKYSSEANMDAQTILGMVYPIPVTSYSTDSFNMLELVNYVLAQDDIPQVISISYGIEEQNILRSFATRLCRSFAQLGARGITVLVISGDHGLAGFQAIESTKQCLSSAKSTAFLPIFPASCPWVTTVGGTQQIQPEVAYWKGAGDGSDGDSSPLEASGSGFSNYFDRPAYQNGVVDTYIKNLNGKYKGLYNSEGRGYPDISAQALNFPLVLVEKFGDAGGTSASAPVAASILALVNDVLLSEGRPPLGWINPWLYAKGYEGFTDITSGNSSSCGTDGFPVVEGWDPVTGFEVS